ncbi:MAG: ABC transporter ATP-binding protein/permease, partial [Clostridia bacterium]|nr:ABC transporter ATP-binding protein/permease [Clostridia bacterium]
MLTLKNITKDYVIGDTEVHALQGITVNFRKNEFVSVLGPSGCGKTTLLNIIGGLDHYTNGDLVINGRSTKEYGDKDWDAYRNHSVGFVFQTYNLIPHQSVLSNVELALTLSGVSKAERRDRALKVLEQVGLSDQVSKKPTQMSGGQMQRVAIARALINDPDILLADEPTGALDSETSIQILDLLKEIAKDKLVIMVTHNPELAEAYSTRIIRLLDGAVTGDSDPYDGKSDITVAEDRRKGSPSMSFGTALSLSLNNLMTKKARTILTAFAGSIGIIGIALIMSLSNGIQMYIDRVQEDTLSSYPITIEAEAVDLSSLITTISGARPEQGEASSEHDKDAVYSNVVMHDLMNSLNSMDTQTNNLKAFKEYLDSEDCPLIPYSSAIQYSYDVNFNIYTEDKAGDIIKADVIELLESMMSSVYGGDYSSYFSTMGGYYSNFEAWEEMLPGEDGSLINGTLKEQYDVLYGEWPQSYNEVVLIVDENNEISDLVLYSLGLKTADEMTEYPEAVLNQEQLLTESESWSYEDICGISFKLILPAEYYQYDPTTGAYVDLASTDTGMSYLYNSDEFGLPLRISGIVRQNEDAVSGIMNGSIGYTSALTEYVINATDETEIVSSQLNNPETDVISGLPFPSGDAPEPTDSEKSAAVDEYLTGLGIADKAVIYTETMAVPSEAYVENLVQQNISGLTREYVEEMLVTTYAEEMGVDPQTVTDYIAEMDDETLFSYVRDMMAQSIREQYAEGVRANLGRMNAEQLSMTLDATELTTEQYDYIYNNFLPPTVSDSTYEDNLDLLGFVDFANPSSISIYSSTFADKDAIADTITDYNDSVAEEDQINYTDYVALLMSSITTIINAISYVLIAFVAISLVVSSIMIGIITYISVLERTKEIGILRAMGASKRDISRVFNAETLIEGFISGIIGIGITLLLILPINALVHRLTGIMSLNAVLPTA